MSLNTMPNEVLLIIFRSLYPPSFFSDIDWLATYGLEDEGDFDDEDKEEEEEEEEEEEAGSGEQEEDDGVGEDNENDDTDLSDDGDEDEDEDQHVDDKEDLETASSTSSTNSRTAREIAAWEQVTEADETMKSISQTCRHLRATSQTILQDHIRLEIEKKQRKMTHLDWRIIRDTHGTKLSDAKGEYQDSVSDWNKTWAALGESLRGLRVPAWVVEQEESEVVNLLWRATETAQLREIFASRRPALWWPRPY